MIFQNVLCSVQINETCGGESGNVSKFQNAEIQTSHWKLALFRI
jgi:hypothetical protein